MFEKLAEEGTLSKYVVKIIEANLPECFDERMKDAKEELEFWKNLKSEQKNKKLKEKQMSEFLSLTEKIIKLPRWKLEKKTIEELKKYIRALEKNSNIKGATEQLETIEKIIEEKNGSQNK